MAPSVRIPHDVSKKAKLQLPQQQLALRNSLPKRKPAVNAPDPDHGAEYHKSPASP
jgi:hypothetical protein